MQKQWKEIHCKDMDLEVANITIEKMLNILYEKDKFLLSRKNDLTERSITHRMGMYLQELFPELHVDCEYNRMGKLAGDEVYYTQGDYFVKTVCLSEGLMSDEDDNGSRVFPDIIVHKRGTATNLIIIEVKVQWKNSKAGHDMKKLNAYKNDLKYEHAFYIELTEKRQNVKVELI
jgi:hypothetical protein